MRSVRAQIRTVVSSPRALRALPHVVLAGAALLTACDEDLEKACMRTHAGESFAVVEARLDRTGARHFFGPPTCQPGQHLWQQQIGFGALSCYVTPGPTGSVVKVDYHAGN